VWINSFPWPLSPHFPKSHADTAAVVVDEFDPRGFKGVTNHDQGRPAGLVYAGFQLADGHDPDLSRSREILLTPVEQASGGSALGGRYHQGLWYGALFRHFYRK
jgi:hypothetical protein